ncbi:histone deacetylase [Pseudovibrio exalbescens]|uniref:histone deacetylase family protein n=1 Tax=Pseudovibrio exalbescens TaxID=197461 RepID=UPI0023664577|nr:histone deacetylase [Pseudovibrio exalbescens]MDD7911133.1 histone deacetylase [Pseudovibrio exalbescens]
MKLPVVHHPAFTADIPSNHRFPMLKFKGVADTLLADGIVLPGGFVEPAPATREQLIGAHDETYVDQVLSATVPDKVAREIGFPMTHSVGFRGQCATGGSIETGRLALRHGIACNTAGGSHHARRLHGAGFCVFNDVAVAVRALQAEGLIRRALVVDLDVHQGDGTAEIFREDPSVFTFSMHSEKNYPVRKVPSDLDIPLPDNMEDGPYLEALDEVLEAMLRTFDPDIVFYNAGVDPHMDDRLGRLALTDAGLYERDARVMASVRGRGLPLACVLGGGYSQDIPVLARRHTIVHRVASGFA